MKKKNKKNLNLPSQSSQLAVFFRHSNGESIKKKYRNFESSRFYNYSRFNKI